MTVVRTKVHVSPMTPAPLTDVDVRVCQTHRRADMSNQAVRPGAQPLAKLDNADLHTGVTSVLLTVCQTVKTAAQLFFRPRLDRPKYMEISIQCRILSIYVRVLPVILTVKMALCHGNRGWRCSGKTASRIPPEVKQTDHQTKTMQKEQ